MAETYIEAELREIRISEDPRLMPNILLGEKDGARLLPIYIGPYEAAAMDLAVRGQRPQRPMTHDLLVETVRALGGTLLRVLVVKLEQNTFFGALEVRRADGEIVHIDARPSDAIVIAAKESAPIFVEEQVFEEVGREFELPGDEATPDPE